MRRARDRCARVRPTARTALFTHTQTAIASDRPHIPHCLPTRRSASTPARAFAASPRDAIAMSACAVDDRALARDDDVARDEPIATTTPIAALEVRRRATTRANDDANDDAMRFERVV